MRVTGHRAADYAAMAEAVALGLAIEVGLRFTSVPTLLVWLERLRPASSRAPRCLSYRLDQFAAAAYRLLPLRATCLRESLVLYGLLSRRGARPRLCVGVRKDDAGLTAHAWIECAGLPQGSAHADYDELRGAATSA